MVPAPRPIDSTASRTGLLGARRHGVGPDKTQQPEVAIQGPHCCGYEPVFSFVVAFGSDALAAFAIDHQMPTRWNHPSRRPASSSARTSHRSATDVMASISLAERSPGIRTCRLSPTSRRTRLLERLDRRTAPTPPSDAVESLRADEGRRADALWAYLQTVPPMAKDHR
jgi:hypothetical protein